MDKQEIGGYFELEKYRTKMLYDSAVKLNCGRNCLAYLIKVKNIKVIYMPYYICDVVVDVCNKYNVKVKYYHVDKDFKPKQIVIDKNEWIYLVNYYGQLSRGFIKSFCKKYKNVILDFAQSYFEKPIKHFDTIYTCRKFFGVSDGGILFTDNKISEVLPFDESYERMNFVLGRFERSCTEFFQDASSNNEFFNKEPIKKMSKITENMLRSYDYRKIKRIRTKNYAYLSKNLADYNLLNPKRIKGAFSYPLLVENGNVLRKILINEGVFVPTLWPNVIEDNLVDETDVEYQYANNLLPIPIDQRYTKNEMDYIVSIIKRELNK